MTDEAPFIVDGIDIESQGEYRRLIFTDSAGTRRSVILHVAQLPAVASALHAYIEPGKIVPIDPASLQIGASVRVQGFQFSRNASAETGATLTLLIEMPDQGRTVTLALHLTPRDLTDLVAAMS